MDDTKYCAGAMIERGIVSEKTDDGVIIRSITRYGIVTPVLDDATGAEVGDLVYFFMFPDGMGAVIGKARG